MTATLHIFKAALDDLQDTLDWYESQSTGLEQRFSKELNARLTFISNHPEASPVCAEGFRGTPFKKFPYVVYYDFDEPQNVVHVVAVLHSKRDRTVLKGRK